MLREAYGDLVSFNPDFKLDPFVPVGNKIIPQYEVLTVLPNGQDAESFFSTLQHNPSLAIRVDIRILTAAFQNLQRTNPTLRASFNVNPVTIFSGHLHKFLETEIDKGAIDTAWLKRQMLEVLEHDLPHGYDYGHLQNMQEFFGLSYALDDITRDKRGLERIAAIGDGASAFKFHHSVLQDIRHGDVDAEAWLFMLRQLYPTKTFVVEGFRPRKDTVLLPFLRVLGVDAVQVYSPREEMEDFAAESNRMALSSGWGALEAHR